MVTREECRYLHWLTSSHWRGEGHVVEMGPWLGGSTISLAMGMIDNPRRDGWKLHVYDNFVWREFMATATVAVDTRLAHLACGHHISRAAESQRR